jgi:ankyrin repeat protein
MLGGVNLQFTDSRVVNPQVVEYLLESGLSPSSLTRDFDTPLHWAMCRSAEDQASRFHALRMLLDQGNVLNWFNHRRQTALEMAMKRLPWGSSCEDVLFLLEMGADCHFITRSGETALHLLLINAPWPFNLTGFRTILDVLVAKGADLRALIRTNRKTVFDVTVRKFRPQILESLLRIQPAPVSTPDARGNTPLHRILEAQPPPSEYRTQVQHLILTDADLIFARNMKLRTPLMSACANPYVDSSVLADLIYAGSDVNDECESGENPMSLVLASSLMYDLATPPGYDVPSWEELRPRLRRKAKVLENAGFERGPYLASDGYHKLFGHSRIWQNSCLVSPLDYLY